MLVDMFLLFCLKVGHATVARGNSFKGTDILFKYINWSEIYSRFYVLRIPSRILEKSNCDLKLREKCVNRKNIKEVFVWIE